MIRKDTLKSIINEAVSEGFARGVNLFLENLNNQIETDLLFEQYSADDILMSQLAPYLEEEKEEDIEDSIDLENLDEETIDKLLEQVKRDL